MLTIAQTVVSLLLETRRLVWVQSPPSEGGLRSRPAEGGRLDPGLLALVPSGSVSWDVGVWSLPRGVVVAFLELMTVSLRGP